VLTFALGIAELPGSEALVPSGGRMRFEVRARFDADVEASTLFEREVHVTRRNEWIEQRVELGRFAGEEVWLSFHTSGPASGTDSDSESVGLLGVFGDPIVHDSGRYRDDEPRAVLLVSLDTLRRDHVTLHGYPRRTTPGLEALAGESIVFDDAVSTSSWTLPAHSSLLTSTYPSVHGAVNLHVGLSREWDGLPRLFRDQGYMTQALVTHLYLSSEYGLDEGFVRHRLLEQARAEQVTDEAISFLHAFGDRDFFLFLHYYDPHWHYDPPPPYDRTFDPTYDGEVTGVWWEFKELEADTIDERDRRHIEALYDGEILYTDRHLERLFIEMKRLGVFDRALIVVTSDHGEEFLEHGGWEHQKTLYEEQLRIPLIVKLPGGQRGGTRIDGQASLIDVAPMVADVAGLPRPPTFQGRNLLELELELGRADSVTPSWSWSETEHTLDGSHLLSMRSGADGEKTLFVRREETIDARRYNLALDPNELQPMDGDGAAIEILSSFLREAEERRSGKRANPSVDLDEEQRDRLRALGYVP
jgi:arylsulfatase A-like enzyme